MVFLGRSIIGWIFIIAVAVGVFLLAQWAIPTASVAVFGSAPPLLICNILAFFLAAGVFYGWYSRPVPA